MITNTRNKIVEYIKESNQLRAHDLARLLNISGTAIHKQLKKLINEGELEKIGKPPKVYYVLASKRVTKPDEILIKPHVQEVNWDQIWKNIRKSRAITGKGKMSASEFLQVDRNSH